MHKLLARIDQLLGQYIHNEVPARLIYVPERRLVNRSFVLTHSRERIYEAYVGRSSKVSEVSLEQEVRRTVAYATLSHRWGPKEPTYADYATLWEKYKSNDRPESEVTRRVTEPGYVKLWNFLEEASARGMQFAWADTCCIDKSSSAELDEAIRSMFRWYRNSALCIVHLAQTRSAKDIAQDAWFRRGWTLQELLAPPKIKFMDQDWKPLVSGENDKDDQKILSSVTKATGIAVETLSKAFEPRTDKFSEKMSWASRRSTTRAEDAAYSLMGMLNVSIQTAYGEGGPRAFRRLLRAVMHKTEDPSVMYFRSLHLPESPADYLPNSHTGSAWSIKEPFNYSLDLRMGRRGLKVKALVLPVKRGYLYPNARCPALNNAFVTISAPPSKSGYFVHHKYALGVVSYFRIEGTSRVVLPSRVIAYLLGSYPDHRDEMRHVEGWQDDVDLMCHARHTEKWSIRKPLFEIEIPGCPTKSEKWKWMEKRFEEGGKAEASRSREFWDETGSRYYFLDEQKVGAEYHNLYIRQRDS